MNSGIHSAINNIAAAIPKKGAKDRPTFLCKAIADPHLSTSELGTPPSEPESSPFDPEIPPSKPEASSFEPGSLPSELGTSTSEPETSSFEPGTPSFLTFRAS